jgi:large subunit ribosomal protein L11
VFKPAVSSKLRFFGKKFEIVNKMAKTIEALVDAGNATPGPPLGPQLGPLGVNIKAVIDEINKKTQDFKGMKVPVTVEVDDSRQFSISIGVPPTSSLLLSEAGVEKGSGTPNSEKVGNLKFDQCVKVAKMKQESMLAISLRSAVKEVVGTCISIGLTIDDLEPKQIIEEINAGTYDAFF